MGEYNLIIILALFGFIALAFILLAPVYFFLKREERASQKWTQETFARRIREHPPSPNGTPHREKDHDVEKDT